MRSTLAWTIGLAWVAGVPAHGRAQTTTGSIQVEKPVFEGRESDDPGALDRAVNAEECTANITMDVGLRNIPSSGSFLDVWRGGEGENCNDTLLRDGEGDDCEFLELPALDLRLSSQTEKDLPNIPVGDLFDCSVAEQNFAIFFLAVGSSRFTGEVTEAEYGRLVWTVDTRRPSAPTGLSDGQGDTQVELNWSFPENEAGLFAYEVWVDVDPFRGTSRDAGVDLTARPPGSDGGLDAGFDGGRDAGVDAGSDGGAASVDATVTGDGSAGGDSGAGSTDGGTAAVGEAPADCPSTLLRPGAALDPSSGIVRIERLLTTNPGDGDTTVNPAEFPLAIGQTAALTVVAVDQARNRSLVGEVVCVSRVETVGLCDTVECDSGCSCSLPGRPTRDLPPLSWAFLGLLGLFVLGRQTRR